MENDDDNKYSDYAKIRIKIVDKYAILLAIHMSYDYEHQDDEPRYVEVFEVKLNQFNWADDENRLNEIGVEFVKEYDSLQKKLFDEFDDTLTICFLINR